VQTVHDYSAVCPTGWNVHRDWQVCATGMTSKCVTQHQRNYSNTTYYGMLFSFFRMRKLMRKNVKIFITPSPLLEHYLRLNNFGTTTYLPPFRNELLKVSFDQMQANHFLFVGQLEIQKGVEVLNKSKFNIENCGHWLARKNSSAESDRFKIRK
jgi:hypothetical protein